MASDHQEQNENEQEQNTEQNDLQQIENLKIQVRVGWWNIDTMTDLYILYHVPWESHCKKTMICSQFEFDTLLCHNSFTWHLHQGQNSKQIS